jgi:hypothetical protein
MKKTPRKRKMHKSEEKELIDLVHAYEALGGILGARLRDYRAVIPKSLKNLMYTFRNHTNHMHHLAEGGYKNILKDNPDPDTPDIFKVKVACGVTLGIANCKTREDAVAQVESGDHDEMILKLLARFKEEGRHRIVVDIEPE